MENLIIPTGNRTTEVIGGFECYYSNYGNLFRINGVLICKSRAFGGDLENHSYELHFDRLSPLGLAAIQMEKFDPSMGLPLGRCPHGADTCNWRMPETDTEAVPHVIYLPAPSH